MMPKTTVNRMVMTIMKWLWISSVSRAIGVTGLGKFQL
jgi:hypothetical protein